MTSRPELPLLATTVVGSYPQPPWLVDHERLRAHNVPRLPAADLWRVEGPWLSEAQNDATRIAIDDMEHAGVDVITDGEIRRESYSNRFTAALEGLDVENPAQVSPHPGRFVEVPRITGPIRRRRPVGIEDLRFLRRYAKGPVRVTLPGPFTLSKQCADEFYRDPEALVMAFADAVNAEARDLEAAGADVIQLDEPWLRADPDGARRFAIKGLERALEGVTAVKAAHLCFGYGFIVPWDKPRAYPFLEELAAGPIDQVSIEAAQPDLDLEVLERLGDKTVVLGVLDLSKPEVESPQTVSARIRAALERMPAERLMAAPDCGMKYLPRASAFGKLKALSEGAAIVRGELTGSA
jgi:5-methyltetrahydropteroyltriglutamate--homocysteine methyltransferase